MNAGHIQELALVEVRQPYSAAEVVAMAGEASVLNSLLISPSAGAIWYQNMDLGFPEIEGVTSAFTNRSGTFDQTSKHRAATVSLELAIIDDWFPEVGAEAWPAEWNSSSFWVRQLSRWMNPAGRYKLYFRYSGNDTTRYFMNIRPAGMSRPIVMTDRESRSVQMSFVVPDGRTYAFDESWTPGAATQTASKDGRTRAEVKYAGSTINGVSLPLTMPVFFPSTPRGYGGVFYDGTIETGFTARIWALGGGAVSNPRMSVTHVPTGRVSTVSFGGLTIASGTFLEIDTIRQTVLMGGDPSSSRANYLRSPLQFPELRPGQNDFSFTQNANDDATQPAAPGTGSYIEVLYHKAHLA